MVLCLLADHGSTMGRGDGGVSPATGREAVWPALVVHGKYLPSADCFLLSVPLPGCRGWSVRWAAQYFNTHIEIIGRTIHGPPDPQCTQPSSAPGELLFLCSVFYYVLTFREER